MHSINPFDLARQTIGSCNTCGYCHGYCPVFDQARGRFSLANGDLTFLANLCHDCGACHEACQYAPPHPFQITVPMALGSLRTFSYQQYAWPRGIARHLRGSAYTGIGVVCLTMLAAVLVMLIPRNTASDSAGGQASFYGVVPLHIMLLIGALPVLWSAIAIAISVAKYWKDIAPTDPRPSTWRSFLPALADMLSLRNWGKESHGCPDRTGQMSMVRKYLHWAVAYGFLCCGLATITAAGYHHILQLAAPYAVTSLPVLFGIAGGSSVLIGTSGMLILEVRRDSPIIRDRSLAPSLLLVVATGLALLACRDTPALAFLLHLHLGAVTGFVLTLPYGHFLHGPFHGAALLRAALERRMPINTQGV